MISIPLGRFKWLHLMNPLRRANWGVTVRPHMWEILFICVEGY